MENNITQFNTGLNTDNNPENQPKGTYRFALNSVVESNEGNETNLITEESNKEYIYLKEGYVPIGKIYIGNNETAIVSVKNNITEIGILKNNNIYEVHVNDETSIDENKLGLKVSNQLQLTYRLKNGCDKIIYWVDNNTKPGFYNFNTPDDFKINNKWLNKKFELLKTNNKIPVFSEIKVSDFGGNIEPGSYNIAVRLSDNKNNYSDWLSTSNIIKIYNDSINNDFVKINGSINSDSDYINFSITNKSIYIEVSNLDNNWNYYQLAIISSNVGSGIINDVQYTELIPISDNNFIYNGNNTIEKGTTEDILFFKELIYKADSIAQIDNRLLLANTKGTDINYCNLQKYASLINTDCVVETIILNDAKSENNPKNPYIEKQGYMPGELYSLGIVYVIDSELSPVFHIPGKVKMVDELNNNIVYSPEKLNNKDIVYSMSNDNEIETRYDNINDCKNVSIWGRDFHGNSLIGKKVRHHRFPLRTDINRPLVKKQLLTQQTFNNYFLKLTVKGALKTPVTCLENEPNCVSQITTSFIINVSYKVSGETFSFQLLIDPNQYSSQELFYNIQEEQLSKFHSSNVFTDIVITESDINGVLQPAYSQSSLYFDNSEQVIYTTVVENNTNTLQDSIYTTDILGFKFSNIQMPSLEDTNGREVTGYYIVRNERTEFQKSILDSAVLTQSMINDKYIGNGLLCIQSNINNISKKIFGFIHPENKFNNKKYNVYDEIIHQGNFNTIDTKYSKIMYNDILDGTSFISKKHKDNNDDGNANDKKPLTNGLDGWSITCINRDNILSFENIKQFNINASEIEKTFYLKALEEENIEDNLLSVYNISTDNNTGIIHFKNDKVFTSKLPYVLLKKLNINAYSNFKLLPYYKETENEISIINSTTKVFNGDVNVSSIRYVNTLFWENRVAVRKNKGSQVFGTFVDGGIGKWIAALALIVIGSILIPGSTALLIGVGISLIGGGVLMAASGLESINVEKAFMDAYNKGLRNTLLDDWVKDSYRGNNSILGRTNDKDSDGRSGPSDDTIEYVADCATDLWFETQVNISLRNKMISEAPCFLNSPGKIETGNNSKVRMWEYFGLQYVHGNTARYPISKLDYHIANKLLLTDIKRNDTKIYIGIPLGEYYNINPDYNRRNKEKIYYHLPSEYNCCSDCKEKFPHRWYWSEQSFNEELSDNYKVFLPNNYKDIPANTGEITNLFIINNNLFIHTEEALYLIPRNLQERVTDQLVSYIGTGSFGELEAQKIVDDENGNSAGSKHKWGLIKTANGVYFPSENQSKIYSFNGQQLIPISNNGISNWFENNMQIQLDNIIKSNTNKEYIYKNNPSNIIGSGFISTYDSKKERIIFTKKDFVPTQLFINNIKNNHVIVDNKLYKITNKELLIQQRLINGWKFVKIENNTTLKFSKEIEQTITELQQQINCISNQCTTIFIPVTRKKYDTIYEYENFVTEEIVNIKEYDNSWTLSYSLKRNAWISWHSYRPNFYINTPDNFYSWINNNRAIWKHNEFNNYQKFYNNKFPFIIEYVSLSSPLNTTTWEHLLLLANIEIFDDVNKEFISVDNVFFNKLIAYNSKQLTGELNIKIKNNEDNNYLFNQTTNLNNNEIIVDKNEHNWTINELRDNRINYNQSLFISNKKLLPEEYIDKIVNINSISYNKDWTQLEMFRDKYLIVRLQFDNKNVNNTLDNKHKLSINVFIENNINSIR